jgi:DNA-binding CsgD family transcriptional regulator
MQETAEILKIVEQLYAASAGLEDWTPALDQILTMFRGRHGGLNLIGPEGGPASFSAFAGLDEDDKARFRSPEALKLSAPWLATLPTNAAFSAFQFWPERDFERSGFYNEVIRPADGYYGAGALQPLPIGALVLSICRPRNAADFDTAEVRMLQALLPHIAIAVELNLRLRAASEGQASLLRLIDRLESALILTDASGIPLYANGQALRIAAEADGLALNGALTGATMEATRRLRVAIADVGTDASGKTLRIAIERPSHRPPLQLTLLPVWRLDAVVPGAGMPSVAIFVTEPESAKSINREMVADAFLLTRRESEVAVLLAEGLELTTIADALGIRAAAVRQYLKRVFGKTGVHSQAALVALVRGFADPCR